MGRIYRNSKELCETSNDAFWEMPALVLAHKCLPNPEIETVSEETTALVEKEAQIPKGYV